MEAMDPEIAARLATGLLQQAMIEAFVFGEGKSRTGSNKVFPHCF